MSYLVQAQCMADAFFLYAACTEDGYVKIGISRTPFRRISEVHYGSPSPVLAAQWVWVGSLHMGRDIESRIKRRWKQRNTRGEWYHFIYSDPLQKREFHDGLSQVFLDVCGEPPTWERLGPEKVESLIRENWSDVQTKAAERKKKRRFF